MIVGLIKNQNKTYPKAEKPELSTGLNEGWRKGHPQGAVESLDAVLGHRPHTIY